VQPQDDALLWDALLVGDRVFGVRLAQEGEGCPIGARRRLDDVRDVLSLRRLVEVGEILAASRVSRLAVGAAFDDEGVAVADELSLHVAAQIEVAAVRHALEFAEVALGEERERVLDVGGAARVVGSFGGLVLAQAESIARQAERHVPRDAAIAPVAVPVLRRFRCAEELDLHLLELARPEREVARRDLVAERLPDLADAERDLDARRGDDVLEVDEDALGGLRTQVRLGRRIEQRSEGRLEHQVELARLGEVAVRMLAGMLTRLARALAVLHLVDAEAGLARLAVDEQVVEQVEVAARLPHLGMHDDRRVEPDHLVRRRRARRSARIVMAAHHVAPPRLFDVSLQLDAQGAVVPEAADPAVDLARLKDEPAPFAQRNDLFHRRVFFLHASSANLRSAASPWRRESAREEEVYRA